jgi:hypothetical protein
MQSHEQPAWGAAVLVTAVCCTVHMLMQELYVDYNKLQMLPQSLTNLTNLRRL